MGYWESVSPTSCVDLATSATTIVVIVADVRHARQSKKGQHVPVLR
jgi:crotonobetainyl-CoA:carnitine CoA-transferase CaiB-like acyl-CoA transferase